LWHGLGYTWDYITWNNSDFINCAGGGSMKLKELTLNERMKI
jgi:hypothetical protein